MIGLNSDPIGNGIIQNFDARVVQTVRNLKKIPSRDNNNTLKSANSDPSLSSNPQQSSEDKPEVAIEENANMINIPKKKSSSDETTSRKYSLKETPYVNMGMRISIDGDKKREGIIRDYSGEVGLQSQVPLTSNHKGTIDKRNTIASGNNLYRTKTNFKKKLMSENNIEKYKMTCIAYIKEDEEIKKLCEFCNIVPGISKNSFESYLEENFFGDKTFLYKLEMLLTSDSGFEKQKKEHFFKTEIKKKLNLRVLDIQYENKLRNLNLALDRHAENINKFEF